MSKFTTPISTYGPGGNIFEILGKARVLLKQMDAPASEIDELWTRVMASKSYQEACDIIREYFPLTDEQE